MLMQKRKIALCKLLTTLFQKLLCQVLGNIRREELVCKALSKGPHIIAKLGSCKICKVQQHLGGKIACLKADRKGVVGLAKVVEMFSCFATVCLHMKEVGGLH